MINKSQNDVFVIGQNRLTLSAVQSSGRSFPMKFVTFLKEGLASINEESVQQSGVWPGSYHQGVGAERRAESSNACLHKAMSEGEGGGVHGIGWDEWFYFYVYF